MGKLSSGNIGNDVQSLTSEIKRYVENKVKLMLITLGERFSKTYGKIAGGALAFLFLAVAFIFLSAALALYIGSILHNFALGFVVGAGPSLLIALSVYFLMPPVVARIIRDEIAENVIDEKEPRREDIIRKPDAAKSKIANRKTENQVN